MSKATAIAPANVGLIKYWGRKDEKLRLPANGSISVNLSGLTTTTTVEFDGNLSKDNVYINGEIQSIGNRVTKHLDLIRKKANLKSFAKVVSINSFPDSTGLSSSSSGFAALTLAASQAISLTLSEKELSILARQGSGSASRSIPDGFVEWLDGETSETSYAVSLYQPSYWDIVDIVAVVSLGKKEISSSDGQKLASTSPFFDIRLSCIKDKIRLLKKFLKEKNFPAFGELIERESLEMHAVMITSSPSLIYWTAYTLLLIKTIQTWRKEGLQAYFTINTGQDVHIFCRKEDSPNIVKKLKQMGEIRELIVNHPSKGAHLSGKHLF